MATLDLATSDLCGLLPANLSKVPSLGREVTVGIVVIFFFVVPGVDARLDVGKADTQILTILMGLAVLHMAATILHVVVCVVGHDLVINKWWSVVDCTVLIVHFQVRLCKAIVLTVVC